MKKNILMYLLGIMALFVVFAACAPAAFEVVEDGTDSIQAEVDATRAYPWEFGYMGTTDVSAGSNMAGFWSTETFSYFKEASGNLREFNQTGHYWRIPGGGYGPYTYTSTCVTAERAFYQDGSTTRHHYFELCESGSNNFIYRDFYYYTSTPANARDIAVAIAGGIEYIFLLTDNYEVYLHSSSNKGNWTLVDTDVYNSTITCTIVGNELVLVKFISYYSQCFAAVTIGTTNNSSLSIPKNSNNHIDWTILGRYSYKKTAGGSAVRFSPVYLVNVANATIDAINYGGDLVRTGVSTDNGLDLDFSKAVNGSWCCVVYPN